MKAARWTTVCLLVIMSLSTASDAQQARTLSYQGRLLDSLGTAVDGSRTIEFRFYRAAAGGVAIWTSGPVMVSVVDGLFAVYLGDSTMTPIPDSVYADTMLFVGVEVESDGELIPRHRVAASAFAAASQSRIQTWYNSKTAPVQVNSPTLTTISVDVMTTGVAVVQASYTVEISAPTSGAWADVYIEELNSNAESERTRSGVDPQNDPEFVWTPGSILWRFPISSAGNYQFALKGVGTGDVSGSQMLVTFYPD